ncbi:MAG: hypothetical protein JRJ15_13900 [Deltaproteobacteria bacterium]|nr:hypothetical protein [Deltaproteobacteria bacterium]
MAAAGLNRIHVGMESASDKVLSLVQKGTDKAMQIRAGRKVKPAGMQLSEYFIPGLGGKVLSKEHALETADALNQINPNFIRLRARAKITSHFGISSSGHFRRTLKSKNLEIVHYYCAFCFSNSTKPNLNLSAKNVNLFLREPLAN